MDYTRTYWLVFASAGLLFVLSSYLDYLEAGDVTLRIGVSLAVGVAVVAVSAYAVRHPDRAGGPTEPNVRFGLAVAILLLIAGITIDRLLSF